MSDRHPLHPLLARAADEAARIARGVRADRLADPTPCADFDTRALVNHWVLYTSHGLEHRARRTELPEELVERDFTAEPDWAEAYAAQLDRAVAAWADPAVWEGDVDLGGTPLPATALARMLIKELVVHGWDVAAATGQTLAADDRLAGEVLAVVEEFGGIYRQYDGFAEPVAVPGDAPLLDRALAASGRDPQWRGPVRTAAPAAPSPA